MPTGVQHGFPPTASFNMSGMGNMGDADHNAMMLKRLSQINRQFDKKVPPMERMFKKLGLDVSLKGMLKQSQIFTGTLGSIYQILGAFIDVMLAPILPMVVPFIRKMTKMIPMFKAIGEGIAGFIRSIKNFFDRWIPSFIRNVLLGIAGIITAIMISGIGRGMLMKGMGRAAVGGGK